MKIRTGFVTNSSSTNFLILSRTELSTEILFDLLGFSKESPISQVAMELCEELLNQARSHRFYHGEYSHELTRESVEESYDKNTADKFVELIKKGWFPYWGSIEALDGITGFFATDSFKYEDKGIYIDGRDCVW